MEDPARHRLAARPRASVSPQISAAGREPHSSAARLPPSAITIRKAMSESEYAILRLGLCQVETREWDEEGNLRRLLESLDEAGAQGAQLAITPECVLHGYGMLAPGEDPRRLWEAAEPLDGPRIRAVAAQARRYEMDVVLGFAERGAQEGQVHNSAALIRRDGTILWVYRKVHCRSFELAGQPGGFTPGNEFHASTLPYAGDEFVIGAFICFDREVTEAARCLRALGAQIIACPLATNTFDIARSDGALRVDNEVVTRCRAAENEVFIAVVNHAGRFNGGSFVVGPMGECLHRLGEGPETRVVDVPIGSAPEWFHAEPLGWMGWGYRRPDVYRKYLDKA